ncbi:MAG: radical SAM protein [Chloroflexi bacterium]|nr:radical SAM protein [Chloroflexota bacterium]
MLLDLSRYTPSHRAELERLLASDAWQRVLGSDLPARLADRRLTPPPTRGYTDTVVEQLTALNDARVRRFVDEGCRDEDTLFETLARWPTDPGAQPLRLSFIGLNVTAHCNISPRCAYCNQPDTEERLGPADWRRIVDEVSAANDGPGAYIYVTGGEPLLLKQDLWGPEGLVAYATARGNSVNINTNGTLITPEVALQLVAAGTGRLHISLDSSDPAVQNQLYGGNWFERIVQGIDHVQLAREMLGVTYPLIHLNTVLTRRNLERFPELFAFVLERHPQISDRGHPLYTDLFPHVIPVGGSDEDEDDGLSPSAEEYLRFYRVIWPQVTALWRTYQERIGVPSAERAELPGNLLNPWARLQQNGTLEEYCQLAEQGRQATLAFARHCYVAPTQATFAPDGEQYRCGWHAIARWLPVGDVRERSVTNSIRAGLDGLGALPWEQYCAGCSLATLYINQQTEARLRAAVRAMLGESDGSTPASVDPA